ncbi:DUF4188 domain-containing protein [Novosphingobium sp. THN1]|uniref:DUF4188 domain-containing protein n=1 Tax=Novosphingobium sp. THN1 TaxID=1016987 RepID=UPI000E5354CA|nr:DUF4188 domain-containing protein [Novosphingobium sp. THN1]AXU19324.1 DUF4188 domain-containing protein [Novosphingobium sp. THN1]
MTKVLSGRLTADFDRSLVVFVIGMRINHFHKVGKWLPVARAMGPMIRELAGNPQSGYLGVETMLRGPRTVVMMQYWRDFDSLEAYARDRDQKHWPAWTAFNKAVGSNGTVGIFHETYAVAAGAYETIYGNMPPFGLGKVAGLIPATGKRNEARSRMKAATEG